jgi:hypothetical protein
MNSISEKFPGYEIISFQREAAVNGKEWYSALIQKKADDMDGMPDTMPISPSSENQVSAVSDAPEPSAKEEPGHGGGLEEKLDKILHMLETLVKTDEGMDDDLGAEPDGDEMMPPDEGQPLPEPAQEPNPGLGGAGSHLFSKRYITVVRDGATGVKMASAKKELEAEFTPHGYRVLKIARKGDQFVAALGRKEVDLEDVISKAKDIVNKVGK